MDFTVYHLWRGKKIWFRWKDGEITTNEPEALQYLQDFVEMEKKRETYFWDDLRRIYYYDEAFSNPHAFYVLTGKYAGKCLEEEGEVPEFPTPKGY